jgi:hypothetical protein
MEGEEEFRSTYLIILGFCSSPLEWETINGREKSASTSEKLEPGQSKIWRRQVRRTTRPDEMAHVDLSLANR